uniref:Uncharacterized protein n=1 Tax=Tetranychus urticae TaxID=32264 RepID=T1KM28_TETUR
MDLLINTFKNTFGPFRQVAKETKRTPS